MLRTVRRAALASALALGVTAGFTAAPAAATPPYALIKLVFKCAKGPVTVTVKGPGIAGSARDDSGKYYFRGRPGVFTVKRLPNGRIAPKSKSIRVGKFSTRTIRVCSRKW